MPRTNHAHISTATSGCRLAIWPPLRPCWPGSGSRSTSTSARCRTGGRSTAATGREKPTGSWSTSIAAPTLSEPARALHIALHAAHHGAEWTKALIHVARALAVVDDTTWREAATLAERLGAIESLAAGLRLLEEGDALAIRLGLPTTRSVDVALRASTPPPVALGFEQLARAQGIRGRARILWRKLVPPREFIRHWDPRAAESRAALALAYARRPFWLLRRAPEGLRAWRHARCEVRAGRG